MALVLVYDPTAMKNAKKVLDNSAVSYAATARDCLKGADCCIVATPERSSRDSLPPTLTP